jgi:1,2-dihydroxy-3-keto-5-methylthiopentene dioxygenase
MSRLSIYHEQNGKEPLVQTEDGTEIAARLKEVGIRFERWTAEFPIRANQPHEEIIAAYGGSIDALKASEGFQAVDVVSLHPEHPDRAAFRQKFLAEHRHTEDEVRFFVDGSGQFYLHLENQVHVVLCEQGDLISVPANTRHWFDMGPAPRFTAIRLFTNPEGWVANFTGDAIADRFPKYGD